MEEKFGNVKEIFGSVNKPFEYLEKKLAASKNHYFERKFIHVLTSYAVLPINERYTYWPADKTQLLIVAEANDRIIHIKESKIATMFVK